MQRKDYYGILGIARDADETAIKTAYRKLALRNHPDTNMDDPRAAERFKEINEAYEVLSRREKRNQYDLGRDPFAGTFPFRPSGSPWSDPFEASLFSGHRCRGGGLGRVFGHKRPLFHSSHLPIHDLPLTPDEAMEGAERDIRLHTGRDTLVFTVSIPAGVQNGTLFSFKRAVGDGQEMELLFRVKVAD